MKDTYKILDGNLKGRDHLRDLVLDERIIFKTDLK
jgi:hypothetical protein